MDILSAEHIEKSYGDAPLLQDVSLFIGEKDKIGLVGVNGAGKTTLLKILAGAETPDSGTVVKSSGVRIGYLPQEPDYDPHATVLETALRGSAHSEREEYEVKANLTRLGIGSGNFDREMGLLSGGQKKRVAIAAATI